MTTRKGNQATPRQGNKASSQPSEKQQPPYATRYVAVDSHLTERNGSTDSAYGLAGERPAGRKLAQDVANTCNQFHSEGYEVISIVPLIGGRVAEAVVEAGETPSNSGSTAISSLLSPTKDQKDENYVETSVGYSVTDGVIITAKLS